MSFNNQNQRVSVLTPYKDVLWYWYIMEDYTVKQIRLLFGEHFPYCTQTGVSPTARTFERAFTTWNFRKKTPEWVMEMRTKRSDILSLLWVFFYEWGLSDVEIQLFMRLDGYDFSIRR